MSSAAFLAFLAIAGAVGAVTVGGRRDIGAALWRTSISIPIEAAPAAIPRGRHLNGRPGEGRSTRKQNQESTHVHLLCGVMRPGAYEPRYNAARLLSFTFNAYFDPSRGADGEQTALSSDCVAILAGLFVMLLADRTTCQNPDGSPCRFGGAGRGSIPR